MDDEMIEAIDELREAVRHLTKDLWDHNPHFTDCSAIAEPIDAIREITRAISPYG